MQWDAEGMGCSLLAVLRDRQRFPTPRVTLGDIP